MGIYGGQRARQTGIVGGGGEIEVNQVQMDRDGATVIDSTGEDSGVEIDGKWHCWGYEVILTKVQYLKS